MYGDRPDKLLKSFQVDILGLMRDIDGVHLQNAEQAIINRVLGRTARLGAVDIRLVQTFFGDFDIVVAKVLPEQVVYHFARKADLILIQPFLRFQYGFVCPLDQPPVERFYVCLLYTSRCV